MPFVPNVPRRELPLRGVPEDFVAWPFVDELFDYTAFLKAGPIATVPQDKWPAPVAVVGAGPAGLCAAFELLRTGLTPVVFEASDRIGGRNWSKYFYESGQRTNVFAEMGAMRVPTQNQVFYKYAGDFKLSFSKFPDPGDVQTRIYYENQVYDWAPGPVPPGPFKDIKNAFNAFTKPLLNNIYKVWSDPKQLRAVWQQYIDQYKNTSFYEALVAGIPSWTTEDLNAFGSLGMGSGGFGPLYGVGFLEMLRILVNQFENDQQLIMQGISALTEGFLNTPVTRPNGQKVSLASEKCIRLDAPVTWLEWNQVTDNPTVTWGGASPGRQDFAAVVVATTTRAMQVLELTPPPPRDNVNNVLTQDAKRGIRNLHLMESSKLFIRTATKFWQAPGIPQVIVTDELPSATYCLDYPQTDNGVVLISYTWGDDSAKLLALSPAKRFEKFKHILGIISPQFAEGLVPVGGVDGIYNVDWQTEPDYFGAFKLQDPGQDADAQNVYFQFRSVLDDTDRGIYLAGDSVSWAGGWTEGALHTGLNAACAVARRLGGTKVANKWPLDIPPSLYKYTTP